PRRLLRRFLHGHLNQSFDALIEHLAEVAGVVRVTDPQGMGKNLMHGGLLDFPRITYLLSPCHRVLWGDWEFPCPSRRCCRYAPTVLRCRYTVRYPRCCPRG